MMFQPANTVAPGYAECSICYGGYDVLDKGCEKCAWTGLDPIPMPEVMGDLRYDRHRKETK